MILIDDVESVDSPKKLDDWFEKFKSYKMNYIDPYKARWGDTPYTAICPVCKLRMYYPGFIHTWMIIKRSDVLNVEKSNYPVLMHKDCATRYDVTKKMLISSGTIPEDKTSL